MARAERSTHSYQLDDKDGVSLTRTVAASAAKPLAGLAAEGGLARAALSETLTRGTDASPPWEFPRPARAAP